MSALAAGAASISSGALNEAGKQVYESIKTLIKQRDNSFPIEDIEKNPKESLESELLLGKMIRQGISNDQAVISLANILLDNINKNQPNIINDFSINIEGDNNAVAEKDGIAIANSKNIHITNSKDMKKKISGYEPDFDANNFIPKNELSQNIGSLIGGVFFLAFSLFWINGVESHPMGEGDGIMFGGPFALIGILIIVFSLVKISVFSSSETEIKTSGVVSVSIPEKGATAVTLQDSEGSRKEFQASSTLARSLHEGEVGIAYTRADELTGFKS